MNSGIYTYFLNGEPTGIIETFNTKILPDGSKFTESVRDAKPFNTSITVKAIEQNGEFRRVEVRYVNENRIHAIYKFQGRKLFFVHENFAGNTTTEDFDLPENCIFFPLMRCFQGETILQVAKNAAVTPVLVPDIQNPKDIENLLKPTFDERTAEKIGRQTIALNQPQSVSIEADLYRYFSKHYDENSCFCVDKRGLLVAYVFAQSANKIWEISLEFTV